MKTPRLPIVYRHRITSLAAFAAPLPRGACTPGVTIATIVTSITVTTRSSQASHERHMRASQCTDANLTCCVCYMGSARYTRYTRSGVIVTTVNTRKSGVPLHHNLLNIPWSVRLPFASLRARWPIYNVIIF